VEGFLVLLGLGLLAAVVGVPIAAFVALSRTGKLQLAIAELDRQVQRLRGDTQELRRRLGTSAQGLEAPSAASTVSVPASPPLSPAAVSSSPPAPAEPAVAAAIPSPPLPLPGTATQPAMSMPAPQTDHTLL
jgi:hypothetical protein